MCPLLHCTAGAVDNDCSITTSAHHITKLMTNGYCYWRRKSLNTVKIQKIKTSRSGKAVRIIDPL